MDAELEKSPRQPAFEELADHGLTPEQVASLPADALYALALDSSFMDRHFDSTQEIASEIEEKTGLDTEAQRKARETILSHGDTQGFKLESGEKGYKISLTQVGRHKLIEKIEHFKDHGSANGSVTN